MEVICIKELRDDKAQLFIFEFGVNPPVKDSIYNVSGIFNIAGVTFLHLAEYPPPTWSKTIAKEIHLSFQKEMFAEVPEALTDEINEALKVPAPMVKELEPLERGGFPCRHKWVYIDDWDWQVKIKPPFFVPEPLTHLYL